MFRSRICAFILATSSLSILIGQDASSYVRHDPYSRTISNYIQSLQKIERDTEALFQKIELNEANTQRILLYLETSFNEKIEQYTNSLFQGIAQYEANNQRRFFHLERFFHETAEPFLNRFLSELILRFKRDFSQQLESAINDYKYDDSALISQLKTIQNEKDKNTEFYSALTNSLKKEINDLHTALLRLKTAETNQRKTIATLKVENAFLNRGIKELKKDLAHQEALFENRFSALTKQIKQQTAEIEKLKKNHDLNQFQINPKEVKIDIIYKAPPPQDQNESPCETAPPQPEQDIQTTHTSQTSDTSDSATDISRTTNPYIDNVLEHPVIVKMLKAENIDENEYEQFETIFLRLVTTYCISFSLGESTDHGHYIEAIQRLSMADCSYFKASFYKILLNAYINNPPEIQKNLLIVIKNSLMKSKRTFALAPDIAKNSLPDMIQIIYNKKAENFKLILSLENATDAIFFKIHFSYLLELSKMNKSQVQENIFLYLEYLIYCFCVKEHILLDQQDDLKETPEIQEEIKRIIQEKALTDSAATITELLKKQSLSVGKADENLIKLIFKNFRFFYLVNHQFKGNKFFFNNHPVIIDNPNITTIKKEWFIKEIIDNAYRGETGYDDFRKKLKKLIKT